MSYEEVCLKGTSFNIQGNFFIKSLPYFLKLHTIEFSSCLARSNFEDIVESLSLCSKLRKLVIINTLVCSHDNLTKFISSLKNIESLTLNFIAENVVLESIINLISSTQLQLKYLNLSYNKNLRDNDLKSLSNLPNLEELDISVIDNITGSALVKFPILKKLHCFRCKNLEDDNLIKFLKRAIDLEFLDIRCCKKLTTSAINAAIEITKKRTNNVVLEIEINRSEINFETIKDKSFLLYLNTNK